MTATYSLALGDSPVILKQLLRRFAANQYNPNRAQDQVRNFTGHDDYDWNRLDKDLLYSLLICRQFGESNHSAKRKARRMELGCSTILYGGHDLEVAMERIQATGYRAIELCCIPGMAPHLAIGGSDAYYRDIRRRAGNHRLVIESLGASGNLEDGDRFLHILDAAASVGAPLVTTGPGGKPDEEESFKTTVQKINALAVQAAERGVRLGIKPHVGNAVYNTDTAFRFMQMVDRNWVGINYDATHIWRSPQREVPEECIGRISRYIVSLRIRDVKGRQSAIGPVENQVAGQGDMDLPAQADAFRMIPGLEYAILEIVGTRDMGVDDVDSVLRRSFDYFRPLFE